MSKSSYKHMLVHAGALLSLLAATSSPAKSDQIRVNITIDNSYALFYGTQTAATNFVGSDFDWTSTETYNFNLPNDRYLYVVTASDRSVAQGFLGQFENLDAGYKFYSNDSQWQVMATGLGTGAPYSGSAANLALLTQEIVDANGGGNPSNGWVATTAGPANGGAPWGLRPGIDAAARWVWYSSNGDTDPTTPGFNHDEWLVFRIALAASPESATPEPGTLGMVALALVGWVSRRKFRS
ncbi:MAG: PEP-CTERM sorting domain-containing protein [Acidobacteria bacterium]|nr:PEP-CTERM sorting domain-containing protein [Acidobacteriota bacterium]